MLNLLLLSVAAWARTGPDAAGMPVDIAPSAYQFRADRRPEANPPESWIALIHYARLPLTKKVDLQNSDIKQALCGLLWEEIRPVQTLELVWPVRAQHIPAPADLTVSALIAQSPSSSWWNNLRSVAQSATPAVSADGRTLTYPLALNTCGLVVAVNGPKEASSYDVPQVRVLVADTWKTMDLEVEWGFDRPRAGGDYSGHAEAYDGRISGLRPIEADGSTAVKPNGTWSSNGKSPRRRGIRLRLLYMGTSHWRKVQPFTSQADDVARTIVTVWTATGSFSFLASDLENGPILAPEYGFFVRRTGPLAVARPIDPANQPPIDLASNATNGRAFEAVLKARGNQTIRERVREHSEQTWQGAVESTRGKDLPPTPAPPAGAEPRMRVEVPSARLTAQWNLGAWHLLRHCAINPKTGRLWFNDYPYGILAAETYLILSVLDQMGEHQAAADGFDQWLSLPLDRNPPGTPPDKKLPDHPTGNFSEGHGALTYAEGPPGAGGGMDGIHAFGAGSIGWALTQHYWMTGDEQWFQASAPRIQANADWMLRQRQLLSTILPGGNRLWCKGLQPALQVTPDSGGLWMQFYECEAYYWASVSRLQKTYEHWGNGRPRILTAEAEAYRRDLRAAVERSITLSPVVPVRDGTYHSVIPFACYVRGLATGAWGWNRDGSGAHVGPLYWDTVQTAAALISPAGLLPPNDVRVQGYLDVLEDRLLLENSNVGNRDWFAAGWQYQGGLERTANMHLAADDVPVFIRSFLNCYAVDIVPTQGYVFNEHAVHGPPDKIFEEAAFLERFRNMLVMEDGHELWLARATPRAWLEPGSRIVVADAPTRFGDVGYEIVAARDGRIRATVTPPSRDPTCEILLRLRHPAGARIAAVTVDGKPWTDFDRAGEVVRLHGLRGPITIEVRFSGGS